jgi:hypothetical protein
LINRKKGGDEMEKDNGNQEEQFAVYFRRDPKNDNGVCARMILDYTIHCPEEELHRRIAAFEILKIYEDPGWSYYPVYIGSEKAPNMDEDNHVEPEDGKLLDMLRPEMLGLDREELKKLSGGFKRTGFSQYIG